MNWYEVNLIFTLVSQGSIPPVNGDLESVFTVPVHGSRCTVLSLAVLGLRHIIYHIQETRLIEKCYELGG